MGFVLGLFQIAMQQGLFCMLESRLWGVVSIAA
jgi:hypothetical protein